MLIEIVFVYLEMFKDSVIEDEEAAAVVAVAEDAEAVALEVAVGAVEDEVEVVEEFSKTVVSREVVSEAVEGVVDAEVVDAGPVAVERQEGEEEEEEADSKVAKLSSSSHIVMKVFSLHAVKKMRWLLAIWCPVLKCMARNVFQLK